MFNSVFSRIGNSGVWKRAAMELCEVPVDTGAPPDINHRLLTVAGGIALVLSRCPRRLHRKHYPATAELYDLIRAGMRRNGRADPGPDLLLDSFHEVSGRLDPASRHAMRECLEMQRLQERRLQARAAGHRGSSLSAVQDAMRAPLSRSSIEVVEVVEVIQDTRPRA